jgi:hypothetical protein
MAIIISVIILFRAELGDTLNLCLTKTARIFQSNSLKSSIIYLFTYLFIYLLVDLLLFAFKI